MKTQQIISTVLALVLLSVNAKAGGEEKSNEVTKSISFEIKDQIGRALIYPATTLNMMGEKKVILNFHINQENVLIIDSVQSTNGFLATEVLKMLQGYKVYTRSERQNKPYRLRLRFTK